MFDTWTINIIIIAVHQTLLLWAWFIADILNHIVLSFVDPRLSSTVRLHRSITLQRTNISCLGNSCAFEFKKSKSFIWRNWKYQANIESAAEEEDEIVTVPSNRKVKAVILSDSEEEEENSLNTLTCVSLLSSSSHLSFNVGVLAYELGQFFTRFLLPSFTLFMINSYILQITVPIPCYPSFLLDANVILTVVLIFKLNCRMYVQ